MDISNKTNRPLSIKLPGGKVLRLGPGKTGQISSKAVAHPSVKKLIDEGVIEIVGDGGTPGRSGSSGITGESPSPGRSPGGGIRRTGDR